MANGDVSIYADKLFHPVQLNPAIFHSSLKEQDYWDIITNILTEINVYSIITPYYSITNINIV